VSKKEIKKLSDAQVLQGIEDLVAERLKWSSAVVSLDRGIVGMIIGHETFVNMMRSAAEGKSNKPKNELN
jgi:hypothetical protein